MKGIAKYKALNNDSRYTIVTGGRGSAKSYHVAMYLLTLLYEKGQIVLYTRYTMVSAEISIIPEFKDKIESEGLEEVFHITKNEIIHKATGSRILFRGIKASSGNQTANLKSIAGVTVFVLDEAEELTDEKAFDKINLSIRKLGVKNRVMLILNPSHKEHWIYKRFFANGDYRNTTYIHTTYLDNLKNLDATFIEEAELAKRNTSEYKNIFLGEWADLAKGLVFPDWQHGFVDAGLHAFGLDFGFSPDPTALIEVRIHGGNIYVKEHVYRTDMSASDIVNAVRSCVPRGVPIFCDNRKDVIADLVRHGVNARAVHKGPGSIDFGVKLIKGHGLHVAEGSHNIVRELKYYKYQEDKDGNPIGGAYVDTNNHAIDALRYAVMGLLGRNNDTAQSQIGAKSLHHRAR